MTEIDLRRYLRPGDTITWGQACAEPRRLTRALVGQAGEIGDLRCFVGIPAESEVTVQTLGSGLEVHSYCGTGTNAVLAAADRLRIWTTPYEQLPTLLSSGDLAADVVMVRVSPPDAHGRHSLGLADDYFSAALDSARVVLAEIDPEVPVTTGARLLEGSRIDATVEADRPPGQLPTPPFSDDMRAVAVRVAELVDDGATLQFGIGGLPEACLAALTDKRDLGIHSGILTDTARTLVTTGVATGRAKTVDPGVAVCGLIGGTTETFRWAHRNPGLAVRATSYTHDPEVLASQHALVAINAAIEVDLLGRVNSESVAGRYVGAVGGAAAFLRGAAASPGGVPIVCLPSTARGRSRIVPRLTGPVSLGEGEEIVVVTEHGVADLRGASPEQRMDLMLGVVAPEHLSDLGRHHLEGASA